MSKAVEAFITALSKKDVDGVHSTLTPDIRFRGLTPGKEWEAHTPAEVTAVLFDNWFEPKDQLVSLISWDVHELPGRIGFIYRLRGQNPEGEFIVEQQGYATLAEDGRIADMSIVCSGFRFATED